MHYYIKLQQSHSGKRKSCVSHLFMTYNKIHVWGWKLCKCPLIFCCLQLCFQRGGEKEKTLPQLLWACRIEERKCYLFLLPLYCLITPRTSRGSGSNFTSHSYRDGCQSCYLHRHSPSVLQHPGGTTLRTQEHRRQRCQRQPSADGE